MPFEPEAYMYTLSSDLDTSTIAENMELGYRQWLQPG